MVFRGVTCLPLTAYGVRLLPTRMVMRLSILLLALCIPRMLRSQLPSTSFERPLHVVASIPAPESVAIGPDGSWFVSSFGKFGVKGDGAVYRVSPTTMKSEIYATGLDDPAGLLFLGDTLWAADRGGVYRVSQKHVELVFPAASFPRPLHFLNDLAPGPAGTLYVSDTGDSASTGAIFLLRRGKHPVVLAGSDTARAQSSVNGLYRGGGDTLFAAGFRSGVLSVTDGRGSWRELAHSLGAPDGIAAAGTTGFYITDNDGGHLYFVPAQRSEVVTLLTGLKAPADLVLDHRSGWLIIPENQGNRLSVYGPRK